MLRPPIGRIGGKSKIANILIQLFPKHTVYVEPFVGAGNIIYRKPRSNIEVINDLDQDMYHIFKGIQERGRWIDTHIQKKYLSREQFESIKHKKDVISLLLKYHCSYLGKGETYNHSGRDVNSIWRVNFSELQDRLHGVQIYNRDFRDIVKHFDSPSTFFYLDPPYENTKDYTNYVSPEEIYTTVKKIRGKFLLSYNDSPRIREIFKDFNIHEIPTTYTSPRHSNTLRKVELLISNY